jgi:hypothetical protein
MSPTSGPEVTEAALASFFANNPYSRLGEIEKPEKHDVIFSPWGDDSLLLLLGPKREKLFKALNDTILPERFSAIYHIDTKYLEFIYSPFPISSDLKRRDFQFSFCGSTHRCFFGPGSDELMTIAASFRPGVQTTYTDYRNLTYIQAYIAKQTNPKQFPDLNLVYPTSFWVENVDWDEKQSLALAWHLNFYMAYFDVNTPTVLLHTKKSEGIKVQPQSRYRHGNFPKHITAREHDEELLHFWHASRTGDPARRFAYNYQILEYMAHYLVEEEIRRKMRKLLVTPHALDNVDAIVNGMLDSATASKMHDGQKIEVLLRRAVDPTLVWHEIARNIDHFDKVTVFEGGFEVPALAKKGWTADDFTRAWPATFASSLRNIRNGLSHAKENRMETAIRPTASNLSSLQRWVTLISIAATEAMICRSEL